MSRRVFIRRLSFLGGGVVLLGGTACKRGEDGRPQAPSRRRGPLTTSHRTFTSEEFAVVSAAAERILPRDNDPGAKDANVPEYIDRMLQSPDLTQMREDFIAGTTALNRRSRGIHSVGFAEASTSQQDDILQSFKNARSDSAEAKYFELLVVLTLEGFLGDPSYGGNRDRVGWALVGFGTSEPPPGYDGHRHLHGHDTHGGGH
jgi:gluconate 2-dehydrogenase gamma chain